MLMSGRLFTFRNISNLFIINYEDNSRSMLVDQRTLILQPCTCRLRPVCPARTLNHERKASATDDVTVQVIRQFPFFFLSYDSRTVLLHITPQMEIDCSPRCSVNRLCNSKQGFSHGIKHISKWKKTSYSLKLKHFTTAC